MFQRQRGFVQIAVLLCALIGGAIADHVGAQNDLLRGDFAWSGQWNSFNSVRGTWINQEYIIDKSSLMLSPVAVFVNQATNNHRVYPAGTFSVELAKSFRRIANKRLNILRISGEYGAGNIFLPFLQRLRITHVLTNIFLNIEKTWNSTYRQELPIGEYLTDWGLSGYFNPHIYTEQRGKVWKKIQISEAVDAFYSEPRTISGDGLACSNKAMYFGSNGNYKNNSQGASHPDRDVFMASVPDWNWNCYKRKDQCENSENIHAFSLHDLLSLAALCGAGGIAIGVLIGLAIAPRFYRV